MTKDRKEYKKAYYQAHKEQLNVKMKAYYQANKEEHKARKKAWKEAHKEQVKESAKAWREANKEQVKAWKEAHKESEKAAHKAWYQANKEKYKEYRQAYYQANKEYYKAYNQEHKEQRKEQEKEYKKADVNANGQTKDSIRQKSRAILKQMNLHIDGYEIHHCFGYEDPSKFIYINRALHLKIHQYLRDNDIDASSDHWMSIRDIVNDTDEFVYIKA